MTNVFRNGSSLEGSSMWLEQDSVRLLNALKEFREGRVSTSPRLCFSLLSKAVYLTVMFRKNARAVIFQIQDAIPRSQVKSTENEMSAQNDMTHYCSDDASIRHVRYISKSHQRRNLVLIEIFDRHHFLITLFVQRQTSLRNARPNSVGSMTSELMRSPKCESKLLRPNFC
jgi:hypothetical protein